MKAKLLISIGLIAACLSCQNKKEKQVEQLVKEWNNKEILFPENPVFTRFGTDTTSFAIPKTDYKVVIFADSIGCVSCKLQLTKWKEFMTEVDSLSQGKVPFIFIFQSKDIRELRYILKRDGFSLPVCIDTEDSFNTLNRLPQNMMFQTFLIGRDNRVKVIGNPIHNLSVKALYLKELAGIADRQLPVTQIKTDSTAYSFGTVKRNGSKRKTVLLKNIGHTVFQIKGITTSCDCTHAAYDWDEIQPGDSATILVEYRAEEPGDFWRTITIYGNLPEKSVTLDFTGTVE